MSRTNGGATRGIPLLVSILAAIALVWGLGLDHAGGYRPALAQSPSEINRVGLVVDTGSGPPTTRCVEFSEPRISGYEVLNRSGLSIVVSQASGVGAAICKIGEVGCSADNCFCSMPNYWSYWYQVGGGWTYSQMGASGRMVSSGEVEGWRWGSGAPPALVSFEQICAPSPTNTPLPTSTPIPPTDTPLPATDTPVPPTHTPRPTDTPVPSTPTPRPVDNEPRPTVAPAPTNTVALPTSTPVPTETVALAPTHTPTLPAVTPAPPTTTPVRSPSPSSSAPTRTPEVLGEPVPSTVPLSATLTPVVATVVAPTPTRMTPSPSPTRTSTSVASPTATSTLSPTPVTDAADSTAGIAEAASAADGAIAPLSAGHYAFGLIIVGLGGSLAYMRLRRR